MSNIRENSPQVENNSPANNPVVPEAAQTPKSIFESCLKNKTTPHSFSKTLAETKEGEQKLGWSAAVVLKYLCFMLRKQGEIFEDKKWVRIKLDYIASQYPYLSRTGVDEAIQRLIAFGACSVKNLNVHFKRRKIDRTRWFNVPKVWMNKAERELRYFYAPLAEVIGVPAAVLHSNFVHKIDDLKAEKKEAVFPLDPATQSDLQPFSKATIKRSIKRLVDEEMIYPVPGKQCLYAFEPLIPTFSKADTTGSKPDMPGSKADNGGSKADDNSCCSNVIEDVGECSKASPSVPLHIHVSLWKGDKEAKRILQSPEFLSPFEICYESSDDIKQHLPPAIRHSEKQTEVLSSLDTLVSEPASGENDPLPLISNYQELHQENINNKSIVRVIETDASNKKAFIKKASGLAPSFFIKLGREFLDKLYDDASDEELFETLFPLYREWYPEKYAGAFKDVFFYGIFECVMNAFFYRDFSLKRKHPFASFWQIEYDLHFKLDERSRKRNQLAIEQEEEELKEQFESIDADKEHLTELSPAEKARVFKQGLYSRNKIGWISLGGVRRVNQIIFTPAAFIDVERLFELNPQASAHHLLRVMDGCMKLHASSPPMRSFREMVKAHARWGYRLSWFTKHLKTIIKQLDLFEIWQLNTFLNDECEEAEIVDAMEEGEEQQEEENMAA